MTRPDWLLLLLVALVALAAYLLGRRSARRRAPRELPDEWPLMARPVLNTEERRALRLLRDAMPQHVVLAKLPLVRLCQSRDGRDLDYWYGLLGPLSVSFAVCSPSGKVLAAIDLEPEGRSSPRASAIKQAVMEACRIRYLACTPEQLPTAAELQLLLPAHGSSSRPAPLPMHAPSLHRASHTLTDTVRAKRAERAQRWPDSGFGTDSFFAPDSRLDAPASAFAPLGAAPYEASAIAEPEPEPATLRR